MVLRGVPSDVSRSRFYQTGARLLRRRRPAVVDMREQEVLELLSRGYLYREIGDELKIGYDTVHSHVRHIYEKLQVHTRTAAVAKAVRERLT